MKKLSFLTITLLLFAFTINAQDIILEEGFNTGSIPTDWTEEWETGSYEAHWEAGHIGGTNDFPSYPKSGDYNLKAYKSTSTTTSTCRLTTPSMDLTGYDHVAFSFYIVAGESSIFMDDFDVYYKTSAGGTWQPLIQERCCVPDWTKFTFIIPDNDLTDDFYISFVANVTMAWITLDDVKVYEYFEEPTELIATSNTNSVDLSWTAVSMAGFSNYKIYRNGTEIGTTANTTYTDNSVTQNTAYDYYVTAIYNSDESEATNIAPAAPDGLLTPYLQGFENDGNRPTAWANTWEEPFTNYDPEDMEFPFYFHNGGLGDESGAPEPDAAYDGGYCATIKLQETFIQMKSMLITPMLNLSDNTTTNLVFQLYNGDRGSYTDELKLYYKDSPGGDWTEFVHISDAYNSWTELTYELPNTSATYWIGFEAITDSGFGITIDNIIIIDADANTYDVTFNVQDQSSNPIDGAEIFLTGYGTQTTSGGSATFTDVYETSDPGIAYTVTKDGFNIYSDNIIVDDNETEEVILISYPQAISAETNTQGTTIELTFDKEMADPSTEPLESFYYDFTTKDVLPFTSFELKTGDPNTYILTCSEQIDETDGVGLWYEQGTILSADGGILQNFEIDVTNNVGTNIENTNNQINIYPNPASDIIYISTDYKIQNVELTTIEGKNTNIKFKRNCQCLNLNNLESGIYLLTIQTENNIFTEKIIIQ